MRKLMMFIAVVSALGVMAISASAAMAVPHWYVNGAKLKEGTSLTVKTSSKSLVLEDVKAGAKLTCEVDDEGTITNPTGGGAGTDKITSFVNTNCVSAACPAPAVLTVPSTASTTNPWPSVLSASGTTNLDTISNIGVSVVCNGSTLLSYTGSLHPTITGNAAVFSTSSGSLTSNLGTSGTVTGSDTFVGAAGQTITVQNP